MGSSEVPQTTACDAPALVMVPGGWPSAAVVLVHDQGPAGPPGRPQSAPRASRVPMLKFPYKIIGSVYLKKRHDYIYKYCSLDSKTSSLDVLDGPEMDSP